MIGPLLEETLVKIEEAIWEFEAKAPTTMPQYTKPCLRAASKIFAATLFEFTFHNLKSQGYSNETMEQMITELGMAIRELIFKYSDIDVQELVAEWLNKSAENN